MQDFNKMNTFKIKILVILILSQYYMFSSFAQKSADSIKININNLGTPLNSAFSDFAPVISADGSFMIFTSRRPVTEKEIAKKKESKENVYSARYDTITKKWTDIKRLGESINQPERHNSAIALSNDGQTMLLYRGDEGNGDIYISTLKGNDWSEATKLPEPINNEDYQETSASFSPDGKTIYFVSNRPGGKGGKDIWFCTQAKNGKWGKAKNLNSLNTKEDEEGVFMHPDGKTLYFSSKGNNSMGGYDIFKSTFESFTNGQTGGKWTKPVNLGEPINTPDDDVYFVITADGKTGYYASAKEGGIGEKDIYEIKPVEKKTDKGPKLTLLKGTVMDKISLAPLESNIEITDNVKNEIISEIKSNSITGKFLISLPSGKNYGITVKADGYLFHSENFDIPDSAAYSEVSIHIKLEKLIVGSKIILRNIFFNFASDSLRNESFSELENVYALLTKNPGMRIEISGHTDNQGSLELNTKLSNARAKAVVEYLIKRGINTSRLEYKGYAYSQPVATNENEEGRQLNRRVEFKVLSN
jgi:outer membrane protein OmpA-like peptidoglycan-associated protein